MKNINLETMERKKKFNSMMWSYPIFNIKGKYNKALYFMLKHSKNKGKYSCDYEDFKRYLGIPASYRASHINTKILKYAVTELSKFGIDIKEFNKIKDGRKISKIEIIFNEIT